MALGVSFFPGRLVSLECIPWGLLDCTYRAGRLVPGYSGSPTHSPLTLQLGNLTSPGATDTSLRNDSNNNLLGE